MIRLVFSLLVALCAVRDVRGAVIATGDHNLSDDVLEAGLNHGVWVLKEGLAVGGAGNGSLDVTDGSRVELRRVCGMYSCQLPSTTIGRDPGVRGVLNVADPISSLTSVGNLRVGFSGEGLLNVRNGSTVSHEYGYFGEDTGSSGLVVVDGVNTSLVNRLWLYVGVDGSGELRVLNGATASSNTIYLGMNYDSYGEMVVSGAGSLVNTTAVHVGHDGDGSLTISDGGVVSSTTGKVGVGHHSTGEVVVSGANSAWQSTGDFFRINPLGSVSVHSGGRFETGDVTVYGAVTIDGGDSTWKNSKNVLIKIDGKFNMLDGTNVDIGGTLMIEHAQRYDGLGIGLFPGGLNRPIVPPNDEDIETVFGTLQLEDSVLNTRGLWARPESLQGTGVINTSTLLGDHDLNFDAVHGSTHQIVYNSEPGQHITVNIDASDPHNPGPLGVGYEGHARLRIADGHNIVSGDGYLGYAADSHGEAFVSGPSTSWTVGERLYVARQGDATLDVAAGAEVAAKRIDVGLLSSSVGMITVEGGGSTVRTDRLVVADRGHGKIEVTGGAKLQSGVTAVGNYTEGEVAVRGPGSMWEIHSDHFDVGLRNHSSGTVIIEDGGSLSSKYGNIARFNGSTGNVSVFGNDSIWRLTEDLIVGVNGRGNLVIEDGGVVDAVYDPVGLGEEQDGEGFIAVSGGGSRLITGRLTVGNRGVAALSIEHGGVVTSGWGRIGAGRGSVGKVTVSGDGTKWINSGRLSIGEFGDGTLEIVGGGLVAIGGALTIAENDNGTGQIRLRDGGSLAVLGNGENSLEDYLDLVGGTDAIHVWDGVGWAPIIEADPQDDYALAYHESGDLSGLTVLTVRVAVPEPNSMGLLVSVCFASFFRIDRKGGHVH